ncbi:O-methyltransferase domain-containing protein 7 [Elsinoe fawcettii]|nr:O-methyltransferase domain-containing protein 7 [Elsinoe fawcettii]
MIPLELARSIQEIASTIAETDDCAADDDGARKSALRAARTLVKKLENPRDTAFRHAFESHNRSLCLRLAAELKLFHHISKLELATAEQLSERCGAEELLIVRIMRLLTAEGYAEEQEPSSWSPTALTAAMTQPALEACLIHGFDITARVQSHLIEYFKRTNFRCPTSADDGAFQYGIQTDLNFFDFLHANPGRAAIFNTYMTGNRSTRKHWLQWYPFAEKVLYPWSHRSRAKDRNVLLVDMGGGKGRDLRALLNAFPEAAGQVVLQDLPGTLKDIRDDRDGIQFCPHDLFAAQPVKGAEIYYTHFVLHDFPDELCVIMMRHG